jgi:hypothetical protein
MEDVTGADRKGETVIVEHERRLSSMTPQELNERHPALVECVSWIRQHATMS